LIIGKQNIINDGDLSISKTLNLQNSLNSIENILNDNDLAIAKTSGLQTALNSTAKLILANQNITGNLNADNNLLQIQLQP